MVTVLVFVSASRRRGAMSTFQGQCGYCDPSDGCWPSPVFPGQTEQFGASDQKEFRATATVYGSTVAAQRRGEVVRFASATDYLRYKKGLIAAGSAGGYRPYRPPPSAAIESMIATGCPCDLVCPLSTDESNTPVAAILDYDNPDSIPFGVNFNESQLDLVYGSGTHSLSLPVGYNYGILLLCPAICNSTSLSVQVFDLSGAALSANIVDFGPVPPPNNYISSQAFAIFLVDDPAVNLGSIVVTAANSCGSSSGNTSIINLGRSVRALPKSGIWDRFIAKKN